MRVFKPVIVYKITSMIFNNRVYYSFSVEKHIVHSEQDDNVIQARIPEF